MLGHFQSCSKPTLLSAQETMRDLAIIERSGKGELGVAAKYLANDRKELRELCNRIATVCWLHDGLYLLLFSFFSFLLMSRSIVGRSCQQRLRFIASSTRTFRFSIRSSNEPR